MKRSFVLRALIALVFCVAFSIAVMVTGMGTAEAGGGSKTPSGAQAAANETSAGEAPALQSPAAAYCVSKGGEVVDRQPYYNTNDNEQNWFQLSGNREFCKFTSKKDGSRIHVLLTTLYTEQPSLAALAYYAKVPIGSCNGNPASCYCSLLGGTDLFGGINLNGGGWVQKTDLIDTVLETCIFPDLSSIDSWGLTYHSAGIIRGKDLSKVLRYSDPYAAK
ncbi:MAG: hypothetical protein WBS24_04645 [Terriglobales bacterium]